jgi:hypothetical protein
MRSYMNPDNLPILPKSRLEDGSYYAGFCRNANIARWSAKDQCFYHWRKKFTNEFIERIKHREDDDVFDVFDAFFRLHRGNEHSFKEIPLPESKDE